ncbi:hypothetical protein [Aeromonas veronii]|uniref:hypothetical protein n=2 Tax=Aeromonas veronii TaxID=654 RepID=UPI0038B5B020
MDSTTKLIDNMKEDSDLNTKRKLLVIVSILLMAMSVSGATLLEANTFIFKAGFANSKGLGYLLFLGVITLTIRYYSAAYQYHAQLYEMWANDMVRDYDVFGYLYDDHWFSPCGLLSNISMFSKGFAESHDEDENMRNKFVFKYEVSGVFRRTVSYTCDYGEHLSIERVSLNTFKDGWKFTHLVQLLKIELRFQSAAFFRRTEHLEIILPYIISVLSLLSFIFKSSIQVWMQ